MIVSNKGGEMILNQAQAEAVYSAMAALNNVASNGGIRISFNGTVNREIQRITVEETDADLYRVSYVDCYTDQRHEEHHAGQAAFAAAYGLN